MKIKLMSLLAIICIAFSFTSFGQEAEISKNTFTRTSCVAGLDGCYDGGTLTLKMTQTNTGGGISSTQTYTAGQTKENFALCKYIKITLNGYANTTTPLPELPTVINDVVVVSVPNASNTDEYTVFIKKIANKQFTISVAHYVN